MSLKMNDYLCDSCGQIDEHLLDSSINELPICTQCGSVQGRIFLKAPFTDMHPERTDLCNGIGYSSHRELCKKMKNYAPGMSFEPAPSSDKHHGARNESHLHLGKKFSYPGQMKRS